MRELGAFSVDSDKKEIRFLKNGKVVLRVPREQWKYVKAEAGEGADRE